MIATSVDTDLSFSTLQSGDESGSFEEPCCDLGNLDARRDWGHAKDYVVAMWTMLQQEEPDDYVIASGETHSVREFLDIAFGYVGLKADDYVVQDPAFFRPAEITLLHGNSAKATKTFGWKYQRSFANLVEEIEADLRMYRTGGR